MIKVCSGEFRFLLDCEARLVLKTLVESVVLAGVGGLCDLLLVAWNVAMLC